MQAFQIRGTKGLRINQDEAPYACAGEHVDCGGASAATANYSKCRARKAAGRRPAQKCFETGPG